MSAESGPSAALDHVHRSLARLTSGIDSDLGLLGVDIREFVTAISAVPAWGDELRRRACLVAERCGPDSPYQADRSNAIEQVERSRVSFHPHSTLKELTSSGSAAAKPVWAPELERVASSLVSVVRSSELPDPVIDAFRQWRDTCENVLIECRSVEANGCYLIWKCCPELEADDSSKGDADAIVELLRWPKGCADNRRAIVDAAETLVKHLTQEASGKPVELVPLVDLEKKTVTYRGQTHDVKSEAALRMLKVIATKPGEWFSPKQLFAADEELLEVRTDRLKKKLPDEIAALIDSQSGTGVRLLLT